MRDVGIFGSDLSALAEVPLTVLLVAWRAVAPGQDHD